ncbi:MAG: polyphosphate kinase 2 family protein [Gammaproteobacteria bacterium]|nr:polyphosphate kinase 2 family protein [Gammaproteobacteria bacterium]
MFEAVDSPYLVPFNGDFDRRSSATAPPPDVKGKKGLRKELEKLTERLSELQQRFYAHDRYSLLLVFQAMDAAGKDGTVRAVMSGVNPTGCQVFSFKQPSAEERDHDFLWRTSRCLPERGRIGIFNRSYYEEVLVVRVHPEYLQGQQLPEIDDLETLWQHRYESIRDHEKHLARNGTVILKFWLNVSHEEQRQRFLSRLDEPEKNWKFSTGDVRERGFWKQYMRAYQTALTETSRPWAPWYAIPADNKPYMRARVSEIIVRTLESLDLRYPEVSADERANFDEMRTLLQDG